MLTASGITKKYGSLPILKGINLVVERGQVAAIVGPSGAGKTTLLQILGTLDNPDAGIVSLNGINPFGLNPAQLAEFRNKHLGFVFQFHNLLPEFSALENVQMPALINGKSKSQTEGRAKELLDILGLSHRFQHRPAALSGGEQQRVAVARALMNKPDLVLADEPSGNLDSDNAASLHDWFFTMQKELGQTFVLVTHNLELAARCHPVIALKDGHLASPAAMEGFQHL